MFLLFRQWQSLFPDAKMHVKKIPLDVVSSGVEMVSNGWCVVISFIFFFFFTYFELIFSGESWGRVGGPDSPRYQTCGCLLQ